MMNVMHKGQLIGTIDLYQGKQYFTPLRYVDLSAEAIYTVWALMRNINVDESRILNPGPALDLRNKLVCITGKLWDSRAEIERILSRHGAVVTSTIGKQTQYLITGENNGDDTLKLEKAKIFQTKIVTMTELRDYFTRNNL